MDVMADGRLQAADSALDISDTFAQVLQWQTYRASKS